MIVNWSTRGVNGKKKFNWNEVLNILIDPTVSSFSARMVLCKNYRNKNYNMVLTEKRR